MLKANDFDKNGCRTFIVQFPCRKMKAFLYARVIAEKVASNETLRWGILYLFPCSGNPQTILKPLHGQSFLLAGFNPAETNFTPASIPDDPCSAAFAFELSHSLCFKSSINNLLLLVLIPTQTIYSACFNPEICNLRYLCNFSSFSFYFSEA